MRVDPIALRAALVAHPWRSMALAVVAGGWLAALDPRSLPRRLLAKTLAELAIAAARASVLDRLGTKRPVTSSW
jgi:hypothetical protein